MAKSKLLLHLCCGPCGSQISEDLMKDYEVSLLFANSNIDTQEEFDKRLEAAEILAKHHGLPLLVEAYNHNEWLDFVKENWGDKDESAVAKAMADAPEKGKRCVICYRYRLLATARQAEALGFDFYTTSLSVSPYKNGQAVIKIGQSLGDKFLDTDFNKDNGFAKSVAKAKELGLYRQKYCGCEFSKR